MTQHRNVTIVEIVPDGWWQRAKEFAYSDMERGCVLWRVGEWLRWRFPVRTDKIRHTIIDRRAS